jgi:hypothetical protein
MNKNHGFPSNHIMCRHPVENYCKHPPTSHDWDMYYEATEHKNIMLLWMIWSWIQLPSPKATLAQSSKVPLQVMLSYSLPSCCIWTSSSNAFCHLCVSILLNNLHASCMLLHFGIHVNKATNQRYLKLYDFWWCVHLIGVPLGMKRT